MLNGEVGWLTYFAVYTALCCILPMIALGVGAYVAFKQGSSFLSSLIEPNADKMQTAFEELREKNPDKTPDELVNTIIHRQSLRCGLVGAVTSVAGFITLPVALPLDMVMTYRIQGQMVNFIARAYNYEPTLLKEDQAVASVVMFGSSRLTSSGVKLATELLLEVGGKALAKLVPFAGAFIGFTMNYTTTQATGRMAAGLYSGKVLEGGRSLWARVFRRGGSDEAHRA